MTAVIILAAGASTRLGFPKQTLLYRGKTLIEIAIEAGLKANFGPVVVVLGANAEAIEPGIKHFNITIIQNDSWAAGMASSISAAITSIEKNEAIDSAVIMLCDQPFVSRSLIGSMILKQQQTGSKIVACTYKDTVGVPVLFHRSLFAELLLLQGQEGAKKILQAHASEVVAIPFEKGGIDIDTLADYEELIKNS